METRLAFLVHALMENRSGLIVDACLTTVSGHADLPGPILLGADRGYDGSDFVNELRSMNVRPHVAQNLTRCHSRSAIDGRTTRHPGYAASQRIRKRFEEGFGWMKASTGSGGPSPSPPPTTSSACRNCWRHRHERDYRRGPHDDHRRSHATPRAQADDPERAQQAPAIIPTLPVSDTAPPSQRLFQQPAKGKAMTIYSPRRSMASTSPRSSIVRGLGAPSRPSSSPR